MTDAARTARREKDAGMSQMQDWNAYREGLAGRIGEFAEYSPDVMQGLKAIEAGAEATGHIPGKYRAMIALAVAVTTRCDGCIAVHAKKAREAGASKEEIAEALGVAILLNAGAALAYTARVFDALDAEAKS